MNESDRILKLRRAAMEHMALAEQERSAAKEAAIRAGEALLRARELCPPEEWSSWQRRNLDFGPELAEEYMRLALERRGREGSQHD